MAAVDLVAVKTAFEALPFKDAGTPVLSAVAAKLAGFSSPSSPIRLLRVLPL